MLETSSQFLDKAEVVCCQLIFRNEVEYLQHLLVDPKHYFPPFRAQHVARNYFAGKQQENQ